MTFQIPLSAAVRDQVRVLVRNHPDFDAFRRATGDWNSRDLTNDRLFQAVEQFHLEVNVRNLVEDERILGQVALTAALTGIKRNISEDVMTADAMTDAMAEAAEDRKTVGDAALEGMREAVLEPLRPFLGQALLETIEQRLAPLVVLAAKPAVEVERIVTKTVTVDASGSQVAVAHPVEPDAKHIAMSTLGKLFGLPRGNKHSNLPVGLWDSTRSPVVDASYVVDANMMARMISALEHEDVVWLAGPAGSGKSSMPEAYASVTRRPFLCLSFQRAVEAFEIIGQDKLIASANGPTQRWVDGSLTAAIRKPGTVILLDEIMFAPPGLLAIFQTLLSSRTLTIVSTGEVVRCAPGVCFVLADNTNGMGDPSGAYGGTMVANAALVDRAARMLQVDYLAPSLEAQALANRTGAPKEACERMVRWIGSARKLPGFEGRPLSLRRMMAFLNEYQNKQFSIEECLDDCLLSRLTDPEKVALRAHFMADFVVADFEREMSGISQAQASQMQAQAPAQAQSDAPEQVRARAGFTAIP